MSCPLLHRRFAFAQSAVLLLLASVAVSAEIIPHAQDKPPGPPLSPAEAMQKMRVPEGFHVELVASEPDIVNPVAMTFDEKGRIWITESLEYPRLDAGVGRDRIKVLEDSDGDGKADKFSVFAEGFNIPSGIAVGHGGVWVANAPDILFLRDTDGDGKADTREVVVTGFGRDDTHELPNSLTWGPDGWLYGLNGVFNRSQVHQGDKHFDFTCALFRIDPRTHEFQLFAEGTSNPWGVAWDTEGSAFVSACVIDHLWHLAEAGYYIRQGGPYPPFTSPMSSIVRHTHQKAAYCGIHFFDSDAYPLQYRQRLYMGNIHGNSINVDSLSRAGSTYVGSGEPDFLAANDAWFMPVVQKTGPDGCLYILDWYDRYHCYQDARRDPEGIDRLKGRLYRIRYADSPRAAKFDLNAENDERLIERLHSPNVYFRDQAQRILAERNDAQTRLKLENLVLDGIAPRSARMHALWAIVGGGPLSAGFHQALLAHDDAGFRAWGVRAAANTGRAATDVKQKVVSMTRDSSPDVRLQVAIAAGKLDDVDPLRLLLDVCTQSADDKLIQHIVWRRMNSLLDKHSERFFELLAQDEYQASAAIVNLLNQSIERVLSIRDARPTLALVAYLSAGKNPHLPTLSKCLDSLAAKLQNRELPPERIVELRPRLEGVVERFLQPDRPPGDLNDAAALLAVSWHDPRAVAAARAMFASDKKRIGRRAQALDALISIQDESLPGSVERLFSSPSEYPVELRSAALASLAHLDAAWVGRVVLTHYRDLEAELRPRAVELLAERKVWAEELLDAIGKGDVPAAALNINQVRQLLARADAALAERITARWGSIRAERDPKRDEVIAQMRKFLRQTPGDPVAGQEVYRRVCGQCHKLHGEGQEVGPDITVNGRSSFEQLLSSVFDPNLIIGASYQARIVVTADGRVLTGLVVEESDQRVVLKAQGGKLEIIARPDIEAMKVSPLSLMPEDLEKQLKPQELADLFALLTLDKPPADPAARKLPGSQAIVPRETNEPPNFPQLVGEIAPGFSVSKDSGKPKIAIVAEHAGREGVLRTRPAGANQPLVLRRTIDVPSGKRTRLVLCVAHEARRPWALALNYNGARAGQYAIDDASEPGWKTISVDLSKFAGQTLNLELVQSAEGGRVEAGYWAQVDVISE